MFNYLMPDLVTIRRISEYDSYNNPVFEDEIVRGKIECQFRKVTGSKGEEVVSSGTLRTESNITINDMIEIDNEFKQFIQVQPQTDLSGVTQYVIGWF